MKKLNKKRIFQMVCLLLAGVASLYNGAMALGRDEVFWSRAWFVAAIAFLYMAWRDYKRG